MNTCFESFALRTVELIFLCFIALIQLSRLTVDSSTYIEYVLVVIAKFRFFKRAYNIKDMYAVYALKILCSQYDVCRKNLYDFLLQFSELQLNILETAPRAQVISCMTHLPTIFCCYSVLNVLCLFPKCYSLPLLHTT